MKYIVFENYQTVIFSEGMNHATVAQALGLKPRSAGFVDIHVDQQNRPVARSRGNSLSLGIGRDPRDDLSLNQLLGTGDYY